MSCHDIGRGLNTVTIKVIKLYDEGKISKECAREIIATARKGVHWCDGNEDEAIRCMLYERCGFCLKTVEDEKELYSIYDIKDLEVYKYVDKVEGKLASFELCEQCFDLIVKEFTENENHLKQIKDKIKNN